MVPIWVWGVLLVVSVAWNAWAVLTPRSAPSVDLPYSGFLDQVGAGNVASVTLAGQNIDGVFKQAIPRPADVALDPTANQSSTTFERFTSVVPSQGDDRLLPLLQEQQVTVTAKDLNAGSWLINLISTAAPIVLFVGLLFFMGRQTQRGQQNLLGFGRSGAQMVAEERPRVSFADVAGVDEAKRELQEIVGFLKQPERYLQLGARLPRGALLVGPPGTGKTLLARAVAGEADVPFFSISASQFVEMFVGVGASRVRDLFKRAKTAAPSIVFVDELDAVGRQRGAGFGGGNDEREQTLNQLLVEMDGFDDQTKVIVLAATNRPDVLDPALLRPGRFDRQVTLGLPDRLGRAAILKIHTGRLKLDTHVDLEQLAQRTPGFSGADLGNLANEAALAAARRGAAAVDMSDFDSALDTILLGTRQPGLLNEAERRLVAFHEAGHALVAEYTPGADPVTRVTIIPHGQALGVTLTAGEEDRRNYTRDYLLARLDVLLGGRAAEEVVFEDATTGAESDLKAATALARRMVGLWGMSEELGLVWYGVGEMHPFLGRELAAPREYAEATAGRVDAAVRGLIEEAHQRAKTLLKQKRPLLDALVDELLAEESVDRARLNQLLSAVGPVRRVA
ncbi:MAG TPA: ATP-dependent zinc metalloprotease FtsH [Chloroflexota bacterium]